MTQSTWVRGCEFSTRARDYENNYKSGTLQQKGGGELRGLALTHGIVQQGYCCPYCK